MPTLRKMPDPKAKARAGKPVSGGPKNASKAAPTAGQGAQGSKTGAKAAPNGKASPSAWEPARVALKLGSLYSHAEGGHGIVFDTETTGLTNNASKRHEDQPQCIEFGAHRFVIETGEVLDTLTFLVNPGYEFGEEVTKHNGITYADVKDCPPFSENLPALQEFFLGTRLILAHNVNFDLDILFWELFRMGVARQFPWPIARADTVDMSKHITGHRMKLTDLYAHLFNGETYSAHRVIPDVNACFRSYLHLRKDEPKKKGR